MKSILPIITTALLLVTLAFSAYAQQEVVPEATDVLYLKNGSVLRGKILEYRQGDSLRVIIAGGHELTLAESEIDRIVQIAPGQSSPEPEKEKAVREPRFDPAAFPTKGWTQHFNINFSGNPEDFSTYLSIGFQYGLGYQWNPWLGLGVGVGFDLHDPNDGEMVIPLFAELKAFPFKNHLGPYLRACGGYGFGLKNEENGIVDADGGYMVHPAIGWRFPVQEDFFVTLDLGMRIQKASFVYENFFTGEEGAIQNITYRRTTLRLGIELW